MFAAVFFLFGSAFATTAASRTPEFQGKTRIQLFLQDLVFHGAGDVADDDEELVFATLMNLDHDSCNEEVGKALQTCDYLASCICALFVPIFWGECCLGKRTVICSLGG